MIEVSYDKEVNTTYVKFRHRPVDKSIEINTELILDIDKKNWLVGLEYMGRPHELAEWLLENKELASAYSDLMSLGRYYFGI